MNAPVLIGAGYLHCALGRGIDPVLDAMLARTTGLRPVTLKDGSIQHVGRAFIGDPLIGREGTPLADALLDVIAGCRAGLTRDVFASPNDRTLVILATTKAEIGALERGDAEGARPTVLAERIRRAIGSRTAPLVVSNACASGTLAIKLAADLIGGGSVDHALVLAGDLLSRFVIGGFSALHALSTGPCRPFAASRDGISLGEAVAGAVLTRDPDLLEHVHGRYLGGGMGNDANHISGPSRDGEGLVLAIRAALAEAQVAASAVGHLCAHGTGSVYNDAMEAIAFERAGLNDVPINSLKGCIGHTLGAAGLVETLIALHAMRRNALPACLHTGTGSDTARLNILRAAGAPLSSLLLKTSSGFGGGNAALVFDTAWN